jgi:hypothetical protein
MKAEFGGRDTVPVAARGDRRQWQMVTKLRTLRFRPKPRSASDRPAMKRHLSIPGGSQAMGILSPVHRSYHRYLHVIDGSRARNQARLNAALRTGATRR